MGHKRAIDTIRCYIDLSDNGNNNLFSRERLHNKLSKDIGNYLEKYGFQYEILPLGEKGGGGGAETLWEALKFAWDNKDIFGLSLSVIKFVISIPKATISILNKRSSNTRPRAILDLSLETDEDYDNESLASYLSSSLINLKHISDDLLKELSLKYSVLKFDQSFQIFIFPRQFLARYELKSEKQNPFNSFRLIRLFENLRIKNNSYSVYEFIKFGLISRFDGSMKVEENTRMRTPYKKYYLLFSTNILSDYF